MNALSNSTIFNADEAKTAKVFPTFGQNPVNHKTFCLAFVMYGI